MDVVSGIWIVLPQDIVLFLGDYALYTLASIDSAENEC